MMTSTSSSSTIRTRLTTQHTVFGQPATLPRNQLPRKIDVFKCYLWHQNEHYNKISSFAPKTKLLKKVGEEVLSVWNKASMPTIAYKSILESLRKVVDSGQSAQKFGGNKRSTEKFKKIQDEFEKVLDICPCKCVQKGIKERHNCHCVVKIPLEEWDFWVDQTGARKMMIGPIDLVKSAAIKKRMERKRKYDQFSQRCRESSTKEDEH
jgi:ferredoxin-thioredoxin reductase catalytic subunit